MTTTRQYFHSAAPATTVAQGMDATQTSMVITSASGWPSSNFPFTITLDRDGANEEHILVAGRSGTTLTGLTRKWDAGIGVATGTGVAHSAGESVELTMSAIWMNEVGSILDASVAGDLIYHDGTSFVKLAKSTKSGAQVLKSGTAPSWVFASPPSYAAASNRTTDNASPTEGELSIISGSDRLDIYDGSAWQRGVAYSSTGRTGCSVTRTANQSFTSGVYTTISWDATTTDPDSFRSGATITVPTGLAGIYLATVRFVWASGPTNLSGLGFTVGGLDYGAFSPSSSTNALNQTATMMMPLAAGATVGVKAFQSTGSPVNGTASLDLYRVSL